MLIDHKENGVVETTLKYEYGVSYGLLPAGSLLQLWKKLSVFFLNFVKMIFHFPTANRLCTATATTTTTSTTTTTTTILLPSLLLLLTWAVWQFP